MELLEELKRQAEQASSTPSGVVPSSDPSTQQQQQTATNSPQDQQADHIQSKL